MQGGPSDAAAGVREGDVVAGKYRIEKVLGAGGMGVVVAARHIQLDERVALKFLLPQALDDAEAVARFVREARSAVKIKNEHVARVTDVGTLESGAPYIVMEYLEGGDLAAWIKQRGALPIDQAVDFVLQACVAVADAHALGIVHRDLKPANLFCVRRSDGQLSIKVLDFGISKLTTLAGTGISMAMTKTNTIMGSPLYMSPEQMQSAKGVDARTDIWALGVVLYELMAARPPFLAASVMELAVKIANEPAPALASFRPDVPAELEAVIVRCLQKDAGRRYRDVRELAMALLPFAPKRAKASVERISGILQAGGVFGIDSEEPPSSDETGPSGGTLPAVGRTTLGRSRGRSAVIGGVLVAVLAAVAAGTYALLFRAPEHHDEPQAATSQPTTPPAVAVQPVLAADDPPRLIEAPIARPVEGAPPAEPQHAPRVANPVKRAAAAAPAAVAVAKPVVSAAPANPPASAKPSVNCDPPYYFDARGNRAYKPECL
jgi:serine/threonine protein kinase